MTRNYCNGCGTQVKDGSGKTSEGRMTFYDKEGLQDFTDNFHLCSKCTKAAKKVIFKYSDKVEE